MERKAYADMLIHITALVVSVVNNAVKMSVKHTHQ